MEEWAVSLSHNHRIDCQTELVKRFLEGVSSFIQDTLRAEELTPGGSVRRLGEVDFDPGTPGGRSTLLGGPGRDGSLAPSFSRVDLFILGLAALRGDNDQGKDDLGHGSSPFAGRIA